MFRQLIRQNINFIRNHKIIVTIIVLMCAVCVWLFIKNNSEKAVYDEFITNRGTVSEVVSVTGTVKPLSSVDLAFERGGRVSNISVAVGDRVEKGQSLVSISDSDLLANVSQAQANVKKALAEYEDIKSGTRIEEIKLQETQVSKSKLDVDQARISLLNLLKDSFTKADDAVKNKMFSLFNSPNKYGAKLIFYTDQSINDYIEKSRDILTDNLNTWYQSLANLDNSSNLEAYYLTAKTNLDLIKVVLDKCALALSGVTVDTYISQTQIDTWKSNISVARSTINTAISNLNSGYDNYKSATAALKISEDQLVIKKSGATAGTLTSAEASYEAARALLDSAKAELDRSVVKAPIDGVVTSIDTKLGEIVPANKNIISIISYGDYEVESFIPEADIAKVKIGDQAKTTLDAYGSDVLFEIQVSKIDPASTLIDGVPTYKVTFKFINQDERVRSGMTANLDILTHKKENVILIPNRLINTRNGDKYVLVVNSTDQSEIIEKKVVTGLRGDDGNVEIVSGLTLGERVVLPITK